MSNERIASASASDNSAAKHPFSYSSRISSGDRNLSTAGRIVSIWKSGATIEVMFPARGPSVIMLYDHETDEVYECEVRWRTEEFIGVVFLDILGPMRRKLFFADEPVPLRSLPNEIMKLAERPREDHPTVRVEPRWRMAERKPALAIPQPPAIAAAAQRRYVGRTATPAAMAK